MKEELTTILEAMRAAQGELADYLVSADRNAELTIAKLVGILERREVIRAMRLLRACKGVGGAPQPMLAEASWLGLPRGDLRDQFLISAMRRRPVAEGPPPVSRLQLAAKMPAVCPLSDLRRMKSA